MIALKEREFSFHECLEADGRSCREALDGLSSTRLPARTRRVRAKLHSVARRPDRRRVIVFRKRGPIASAPTALYLIASACRIRIDRAAEHPTSSGPTTSASCFRPPGHHRHIGDFAIHAVVQRTPQQSPAQLCSVSTSAIPAHRVSARNRAAIRPG
jgi:hypothetical protein